MKVRIIKDSRYCWYHGLAGEIFTVIEFKEGYVVSGGDRDRLCISKEDAEVVEDVEKSCDNCRFNDGEGRCKNRQSCFYGREDGAFVAWQPVEVVAGVGQDAPKTGTTEEAKHYQVADVQPIELMQATMSKEQFEGYLLGNVIKYALRLNYKGQKVSDAGKCNQYAEWLQLAMNGGKIIPGGKV